jgi:hypothetical protein
MTQAANARYNARLRSVSADRATRELQRLVVDDLHEQCEHTRPLVDGLKALRPGDRAFACKAINDFRETLDFEGLLDGVIDLFMIITSRPYNGETVEQMVTHVRGVQLFLYEQAQLFGLFGDMKEVHVAMTVEDLEPFDSETLVNYCTLTFIPIPDDYLALYEYDAQDPLILDPERRSQLVAYALFGKYANLERLRIALYVYDVLFGDVDNRLCRYEGAPFFYDAPLAVDVLFRGASYYYPRVGALTNEELESRYHPYELLCVLAQLDRGRMLAECGWKTSDLTSRIITTLYKRGWDDPRLLVTPFGLRNVVHAPDYLPQLTLARDYPHSYDDLRDACQREGIRTQGWKGRLRCKRDLVHDYLATQLAEDFFLSLPENKDPREVSLGIYVAEDELVPHAEPRYDVVWYGGRNGTTSFRGMTLKCLADAWTNHNAFACPFDSSRTFPIRAVRRLSFVLCNESDHPDAYLLGEVLSTLLWSATRTAPVSDVDPKEATYIDGIFSTQEELTWALRTKYTRRRLSAKLRQLYNLACFFSDWTDDGPRPLWRSSIDLGDDALGHVRNGALAALTSIAYSLADVPELLELRIVRVLAEKPLASQAEVEDDPDGTATYLDELAPYPVLEIEGDASTIGSYMRLLVSAHRFGLDQMLEHAAIVLQATAEKYAQDLVDRSFFYAFVVRVEDPELRVENRHADLEWRFEPELLDLVKGETVPADVAYGNWQELPLLSP